MTNWKIFSTKTIQKPCLMTANNGKLMKYYFEVRVFAALPVSAESNIFLQTSCLLSFLIHSQNKREISLIYGHMFDILCFNENINIFIIIKCEQISPFRWSVVTRLFSYSKLKNRYVPNDQRIDKQLFPFSHHEESANFCINKGDSFPPSIEIYSWGLLYRFYGLLRIEKR